LSPSRALLCLSSILPRRPRGAPKGSPRAFGPPSGEEPFELPPGKPLTLAAYSAGRETVAYVENLAVGGRLPDMPIFLTPDRYVPCPLEATYQASFNALPPALKAPLLAPPG